MFERRGFVRFMSKMPSHQEFASLGEAKDEDIRGSATPVDLLIQSRNRHFAGAEIKNRHWVGGDPFATAFYNALSVIFPRGETFFMVVLRRYRDQMPEKLSREIRAFIQQEAVHSREHVCFNKQLTDSNYDITKLEEAVEAVFSRIDGMTNINQLLAVTCLEHVTAIIAKEIIANPTHMAKADEEQRSLWLWHACEEVEHKGVAYDTWLYVTRDWSRWKRWKTKSAFMAKLSLGFAINRTKGMFELLRQDGIIGPKALLGVAHHMLVSPAPFRRTLMPLLRFFAPGFHPWNEDDRDLIQLAESEFEAAIMEDAKKETPKETTVAELADKLRRIKLPKVA